MGGGLTDTQTLVPGSTLSYAALASTIVNDPRINLDPQSRMIADLKDEVRGGLQ